jgi:hypothetical protein
MQAAGGPRVVIRRHTLLQAARNQCMAGSINAGALKLYPETLTLNNNGSDHANTPSRTNQPPRTACACMCEGRGAGLAIPLHVCLVWNGRRASARSIVAVMLLAAGVGATIRLETQGPDEGEAMTAMVELIAGRFGEQR